jgi:hypothetical protein
MKISLFMAFFCCFSISVYSQDHGFPFGSITYRELDLASYDRDSSAGAVVLSEFGEAYFDNGGDHNLIFKYHSKIKILKKYALAIADIEIPLYKDGSRQETLRSVKASSFNVENNSIREVQLDKKNVFTENQSKYVDAKKFAIPNVRVGSVIELEYELESPFIFNFRSWSFQSEWPKVYSEYVALIPGNYVYNMTLKGPLTFSKTESKIIKDCFVINGAYGDCAQYILAMKDIPAFVKEDYMTAPSNFMSSLNFELSEIIYLDGRVDKVTKEWKDAEQELKRDERFGIQLKRGKDLGQQIEQLIRGDTDSLKKAKKVYDFIKGWYSWDGLYGKYSEFGIRKAFDAKKGNVGDINLSLIAALRFADVEAEPVILSTRNNGLPIEIHPVLSDFNYVVAKVNIGKKSFLLDATDALYPFGMLPERCLNGNGRVIPDGDSYWFSLAPTYKSKKISNVSLQLDTSGVMRGTLQSMYFGYEAVNIRKKIFSFDSEVDYINNLKNNIHNIEIKTVDLTNVNDVEKPVTQKIEIEFIAFDSNNENSFLFNPYLDNHWTSNPFKSQERSYPVDFGLALEEIVVIKIEYPKEFEVLNPPELVGLSLPNGGGRYRVDSKNAEGVLSVSTSLVIAKPIFTPEEYHYLKELFNTIIQRQNTDLIFNKR